MSFEPVVRNAPAAQSGVRQRLSTLAPELNAASTPVARAFARSQQRRAQWGSTPYSEDESRLALQAAETGRAQTPEPKRGTGLFDLPGNALDDLQDLTAGAFRLLTPNRENPLYEEAVGLFNLDENVDAAFANAKNPWDVVGNLAMTPGIRMLPGSYVAGNLLSGLDPLTGERGAPSELLRHPLMTGLDVLPSVHAAAKRAPVAKAAASARATDHLARLNDTPFFMDEASGTGFRAFSRRDAGDAIFPQAMAPRNRPIRDVLTKRLDDSDNLVPNTLGGIIDRSAQALKRTSYGETIARTVEKTFGTQVREVNRAMAYMDATIRTALSVNDPAVLKSLFNDDALSSITRQANDFADNYRDILDDPATKTAFETGQWQHLPDAMITEYRTILNHAAQHLEDVTGKIVADGSSGLRNQFMRDTYRGEVLDAADHARIARVDAKWQKAREAAKDHGDDLNAHVATLTTDPIVTDLVARIKAEMANRGAFSKLPFRTRVAMQDFNLAHTRLGRAKTLTDQAKQVGELHRARAALARRYPEAKAPRVKGAPMSMGIAVSRANSAFKSLPPKLKEATRGVADAERRMVKMSGRIVPARFTPMVRTQFVDKITEHIEAKRALGELTDATADEALKRIAHDTYNDLPGLSPRDISKFMRDAERSWYKMKQTDGLDPIFVHHAPDMSTVKLKDRHMQPRVAATITTPADVKKRTWDITPSEGTVSLALKHQEMGWLTEAANRELVDLIDSKFAMETSVVLRQLEEMYARNGAPNPYAAAKKHMEDNFREFKPEAFMSNRKRVSNFPSAAEADPFARPAMVVDRAFMESLEKMHAEAGFTAVFDPVMKVWRTSILPLSPRWHIYNILGGAAIVSAKRGVSVWKTLGEAVEATGSPWKAMSDAYKGQEVHRPGMINRRTAPRGAPPQGIATMTMPGERTISGGRLTANQLRSTRNHAAGGKFAEIWDQVQQSGAGTMSQKFGRFVDASFAGNQWFDDLYRTMASIDAYDAAVKAGKNTVEAERAAGQAVREVMQNWDELSPGERGILRSVFPFYSWARFSVGFVARYPYDHPLRTAVMAQFVRNEIDDMGDAFPRDLLSLIPMGGMDDDGDQMFLRTNGINPFRDTADWFSLQGFVGQTNPFISQALIALGVDPATGGPTLYPELSYDPVSGRMRADTPSFLDGLPGAIIPQTTFLSNILGMNQSFNDMAARNPDAAARQFWGSIGFPSLPESVNMPEEAFTAERNRYRGMQDTIREALSSGDLSKLNPYMSMPAMAAYRDQLETMNAAGELAPYQTQPGRPGLGDIAWRGIVPQGQRGPQE